MEKRALSRPKFRDDTAVVPPPELKDSAASDGGSYNNINCRGGGKYRRA